MRLNMELRWTVGYHGGLCIISPAQPGSQRPVRPCLQYFKFEDDNGDIQTVRDILVKYTEDKNYSGIPSREYGCEAVIGGLIREFKLIFYLEACKWVMLV